jgi:hypothetical protein
LAIATLAYTLMIAASAGMARRSDGLAGTVMLLLMGCAFAGMNMAISALLTPAVHSAMAGGATQEATPIGLFLAVLKAATALGNIRFTLLVAAAKAVACTDEWSTLPTGAIALPVIGCVVALCLVQRRHGPDGTTRQAFSLGTLEARAKLPR